MALPDRRGRRLARGVVTLPEDVAVWLAVTPFPLGLCRQRGELSS